VVLTNTLDTREAAAAYALGANTFLSKPMDFKEGISLMRMVASQCVAPSSDAEAQPSLERPKTAATLRNAGRETASKGS
jgi:DNA-binding NarL/FixJ family response regulator